MTYSLLRSLACCLLLLLWLSGPATADILAGIGRSHLMGEEGVAAIVTGDIQIRAVQLETLWSSSNKVESGQGWRLGAAADWWFRDLSIGAGFTHRNGGPWAKQAWWARAGIRAGGLRLLARAALGSPNQEVSVEARLRMRYKRLVIEPRFFVAYHSTTAALGGYAHGVSILIGRTI